MGVLDWFSDPANQGLLNLSAGLLQASGPSRTPVSTGQALGQGMQQGIHGFQNAQKIQGQQQLLGLKAAEAQRLQAMETSKAAALARLAGDPRFAGMGDLLAVNPQAAIDRALPKDRQPVVVAPGAALVDPSNPDAPLFSNPAKPHAPSSLAQLLQERSSLPPGDPRMADYDAAIKKATTSQPLVDLKIGNSLAGKVGDIAETGRNAAASAIDVVGTVERVGAALERGNVNLGPTATLRNKADQFAQVLGVGGQSTEERLVNTRNVIRGLAQFTIGARKALKGQGQVSDYEGKLLTKAESGEIDEFTAPELKDFLKVTDRLARKAHAEHKRIVGVMANSKDESVRGLVPYFDIPDLPAAPSAPEKAPGKVIRYDATGKRIQ